MAAISTMTVDTDSESAIDAVLRFLNTSACLERPNGPVRPEHVVVETLVTEFSDEAWRWRLTIAAPKVLDTEVTRLDFAGEGRAAQEHPPIEHGVVLGLNGGWSVAAALDGEDDGALAEYAANTIEL